MAAITAAVVAGGAAAYSGYQQQRGAKEASRLQSRGVENARQDTLNATDRARSALMGGNQQQVAQFGQPQQIQNANPRADYMQGIQSGMQFTNQGFGQANDTLSPLSQLAQPYIDEQYNLLGMGGNQAYQQALGRVADPMAQQQEQAFLRNNAALGGVGGNVLSALAEQTRMRTEANLGNRLSQLSIASSPALNALQQRSQNQMNQGLTMANIMQSGGQGLAQQETNRRNALANLELGLGNELSQNSQNLGNAQAGYAAYQSHNAPPLAQGIQTGMSAFLGGGGSFGGFGGQSPPPQQDIQVRGTNTFDMNRFGL